MGHLEWMAVGSSCLQGTSGCVGRQDVLLWRSNAFSMGLVLSPVSVLSNHMTLRQLQNHSEPCFSHLDEYFGHSKHLKLRKRQKDDWMVLSGQPVLDFSFISVFDSATGPEVITDFVLERGKSFLLSRTMCQEGGWQPWLSWTFPHFVANPEIVS